MGYMGTDDWDSIFCSSGMMMRLMNRTIMSDFLGVFFCDFFGSKVRKKEYSYVD